jgi:hypothetical protein
VEPPALWLVEPLPLPEPLLDELLLEELLLDELALPLEVRLEDDREPPDELPPPLTGILLFEQDESESPIAPSPPSRATQNRADRLNRSLRRPRAMPDSSPGQPGGEPNMKAARLPTSAGLA